MDSEDVDLANVTDSDTNEPVVTSDIMIYLGPILVFLCMLYKCIDNWLMRKDPPIGNYARTKQAIAEELLVIPLPPPKVFPRASTTGLGVNLEYPELSLAKVCNVSFSPSEKLSLRSKGSDESPRAAGPGSSFNLLLPSFDDDISMTPMSLTSNKSVKRDSSTVKVFKGAQHVRAPSKVRSHLLSQPIHPSGLEWEYDDLPTLQTDYKSSNHCPTETSHTLTLEDGVGVSIGTPAIEIFTHTLSLKQFSRSEGSIPMTVQQVSHSGSYNILPSPVYVSPMFYDSWGSPDEDLKLEPVETWNLKSDASVDISAQVEPSRTSHSITFLKTSMDKALNDSKENVFITDHQNSPEKDQHNLEHIFHNQTQESVIFVGSAVFNSKIVNSCPSVKFKFSGSPPTGEEEHPEIKIEWEDLNEQHDEMFSEDSTYLVQLRNALVNPNNNSKNAILN